MFLKTKKTALIWPNFLPALSSRKMRMRRLANSCRKAPARVLNIPAKNLLKAGII